MNNDDKLFKTVVIACIITMAIGGISILIIVLKYLFGG